MSQNNTLFSSTSEDDTDTDDAIFNEPRFDVDDISDFVHDRGLSRNVVEYESVINATGYGWFQRILLVVCGWAFVSDSIEIQVVSFMLPAACDLEMTSSEKGWLNGIIFVGMMVGGYTFGGTADIKGRRYVLLCSLTINGLFGFLSAFSPTFSWFIVFRFLSGIGVGAALPVLFSYFAEFLPRELRGPLVEALASFLLLGNIMTAGGAWLIIPAQQFVWSGHVIKSWRIFVALFSMPALSAAIMFWFMPESPKFLIHVGRTEEAKDVFKRIYRINHRRTHVIPRIITDMQFYDHIDGTSKYDGITKVLNATRSLFGGGLRRATVPLLTIWFTMSFAYYGLWMWLPEIYNRMENTHASFCSSSNVTKNQQYQYTTLNNTIIRNQSMFQNLNSTRLSPVDPCKIHQNSIQDGSRVYLKTFIVALSNMPGAIVTIATIDKAGRRNLLASSMLMSAVSVLFFLLVATEVEMIVMSCLFSGLSVISWNVLNAIALENYQTQLRSTAFGLQTSVGRFASILGNLVFGLLIDIHCSVPLVLVTISLVIGGVSVFIVPNTDGVMLI